MREPEEQQLDFYWRAKRILFPETRRLRTWAKRGEFENHMRVLRETMPRKNSVASFLPGMLSFVSAMLVVFMGGSNAINSPTKALIFVSMYGFIVLGPLLTMRSLQLPYVRHALVRCGSPMCVKCGYDMQGIPVTEQDAEPCCPECGEPMVDDLVTLLREPKAATA